MRPGPYCCAPPAPQAATATPALVSAARSNTCWLATPRPAVQGRVGGWPPHQGQPGSAQHPPMKGSLSSCLCPALPSLLRQLCTPGPLPSLPLPGDDLPRPSFLLPGGVWLRGFVAVPCTPDFLSPSGLGTLGPAGLSPGFPDWSSTHEVSVVETDYETYALLSTESVRGPGQDFHMATLYSTCPMPRPPPGLGLHPWGRLGAPWP